MEVTLTRKGETMNRSGSDFCNEQAQRMLTLAKESADLEVRRHLTTMARNWGQRAKASEMVKPIKKTRSILRAARQGSGSNGL
jgi:hypothetical protein